MIRGTGLALLLLGLGFAGFAAFAVVSAQLARIGTGRAEGEVVALQHARGRGHPVIRFTTANGETYEFLHRTNSELAVWDVGERVAILHDRRDPRRAAPDTFGTAWGVPLGMGAFALAFTGFGLLMRRRW